MQCSLDTMELMMIILENQLMNYLDVIMHCKNITP